MQGKATLLILLSIRSDVLPDANRTCSAAEFDGVDILFGLVSRFEVELGYFSLSELESVHGPMGLPIERDLYFKPKSLKELMEFHQSGSKLFVSHHPPQPNQHPPTA